MKENRFFLKQCYLLLTRKCNLTCSHCIRSSEPSFSEFMSLELCEKIFAEFAAKTEKIQMLLSGGEPTLHPKFIEISQKAYHLFDSVMINTNGLNLHKLEKIEHLKDKVKIQVSIDGDREIHESIRGLKTYRKTLENITKLSEIGFTVVVATTVSNKNVNSLSFLDKNLEDIAFSSWKIKRIVGYGRANDGNDISSTDWNVLCETVAGSFINYERISIKPMFSIRSIASTKVVQYSNEEMSVMGTNCGTGRSKLYINPNGTVYPCACMEENIIGDLSIDSYESIAGSLSNLNILPNKNSICYQCRVFSMCQGGCPGINRRYLSQGDPRCPIISKSLLSITEGKI
ncbi:radical SAM/SPASM domain-containing protein [Thiothrix subterranea]|uniref:Radical SAM protein n=1 Tax=Thiothrix subterranea TaxID=2735563 RepID=A0AA51MRI3_9GAMM|nr:radical SAM protein [Thiothrix subterranea]WML88738.1 radical SAM protein [Thiothrix subterranea]